MSSSNDTAQEEVTTEELLRLAQQDLKIDLHTAIPARVESYDSSKQTVDVVPALNRALPDGQGGYTSEPLPKLADVPVCFPRCKAFAITFPLVAGDTGLLVICQRNIGAWRSTGSEGDPGDLGHHTLDGAVFVPGLYPDAFPSANASSTNMVLGREDQANARIEITPTEMHLGAGATKGVARNTDPVDLGTWTHTPASGVGVTPCLLTYQPPGAVLPIVIGPSGQAVDGQVSGGSAHVKAVD